MEVFIKTIAQMASARKPILIGIDGLAGAGKTTLCLKLRQQLSKMGLTVAIFRFDDWWQGSPESDASRFQGGKHTVGDDYRWKEFRQTILEPLREGKTSLALANQEIANPSAVAVVIVEGVTRIRRELRSLYDFRLFVMDSREGSIERAIKRDGGKARNWYQNYWKHEEDLYLESHTPHLTADLIVSHSCDGKDYRFQMP
jgi:uridine kinase